ncbi:MAG: hypothetical protein CL811_07885 [Colwelliaceae bacterium]|nr:hypothetical protein [Colwelliaceae bacterium]
MLEIIPIEINIYPLQSYVREVRVKQIDAVVALSNKEICETITFLTSSQRAILKGSYAALLILTREYHYLQSKPSL